MIAVILTLSMAGAISGAEEPIVIGHITPLSGMFASAGIGASRGAQLAVDIINEKGGINGRKLKLVTRDDQLKPALSIAAAREMRERLGINLIMGANSTSTALAVAPLAPELNFVFVVSQSSSEKLRGLNKNTFHAVFDPRTRDFGIATVINKKYPAVNKWACIGPDYDYGHYSWDNLVYKLQHLNPATDIVASRWPPFGAGGGYGPHIQAIQDSGAEGLYTGLWGGDLVAFIREAKEYGLFSKMKVFISPYFSWETVISLGAAMPEIWMGEVYYNGLYNFPESQEFEQRLAQKYGDQYALERQGSASLGYAGITALAAALRVTGGSDKPRDIIKAFQDLRYKSILGPTWIRAKENGVYAGISFSHVVPDANAQHGYKVVESIDLRGMDYQWPVQDVLSWRKVRQEWFKKHAH